MIVVCRNHGCFRNNWLNGEIDFLHVKNRNSRNFWKILAKTHMVQPNSSTLEIQQIRNWINNPLNWVKLKTKNIRKGTPFIERSRYLKFSNSCFKSSKREFFQQTIVISHFKFLKEYYGWSLWGHCDKILPCKVDVMKEIKSGGN